MIAALIASQIISWLVIAAMGVALLALARQIGVLHVRVAPAGALTAATGPAVGDVSPKLHLHTLGGDHVTIGGALARGRMQLLMFVSPMCPICKQLIPVARSFARREALDVVFIGDDDPADQRRMIADLGIADMTFVNGSEAGRAFQVDKLPHAVLLDHDGVILSKGLVNSREHLESLVVSHEMGMKSVQDYIVSLKTKTA
jgi:methylamine dehydrogenase accessory protein MauD